MGGVSAKPTKFNGLMKAQEEISHLQWQPECGDLRVGAGVDSMEGRSLDAFVSTG